MQELRTLLNEYNKAPEIFHVGRYWKKYEDRIIKEIENSDLKQLRSGKYPIFGTFGFSESVYHYHPDAPFHKSFIKKLVRKFFITGKASLPYSLKLDDIREMAYKFCMSQGKLSNIKCISEIEASSFGNPGDLFEIKGKKYTMQFLNFYIRLCYAQSHLKLKGDETIVELGSGSGFQTDVLKKVFPKLTILNFDLPYPLYLCENFLKESLGHDQVVPSSESIKLETLANIEKEKVHMLGNWQTPLLQEYKFDVFWNAASFGEMEPHIVKNYLSYVLNNSKAIFLLQARQGKESSNTEGVVTPINFSDYDKMLSGYDLINEADAYEAHRRMSQSGGYFQAVWRREN